MTALGPVDSVPALGGLLAPFLIVAALVLLFAWGVRRDQAR